MDFGELLPELIFQTVREQGYRPTGPLFSLNSYENRVYEIQVEAREPHGGVRLVMETEPKKTKVSFLLEN